LPSNSPHDHLILREHLVGSHGRWKRPCLQSASSSSARTAPPIGIAVPPNIPYLLLQGLYRGIIPATMGAVFAHGIRTGVYEFVQSGLGQLQDKGLAPVTDVQIQVAPRPLSFLVCARHPHGCVRVRAVGAWATAGQGAGTRDGRADPGGSSSPLSSWPASAEHSLAETLQRGSARSSTERRLAPAVGSHPGRTPLAPTREYNFHSCRWQRPCLETAHVTI
jgi:hypothetical protein